jgi:protease-4
MESALTGTLTRIARMRVAPLILELDLTEGILEARPADPLSAVLSRHQLALADIVNGLRQARTDDRVKALVVKVGGRPIGLGMVQELRGAVQRFRTAGKLTVAWAESFGEFSAGNVPYYLATAFETIYLQPSGDLGLTGLAVERVFLRGALDKLGVTFEVGARHEYKSAAEQLTEHGFSAPAREATERMTESIAAQLAEAVAERGQLSAADAAGLVGSGPYLADQALAAGLVDALGYRDEVYADVRKRAGSEAMLIYLSRYQRSRELVQRARRMTAPRQPAVALIHATGAIRRGRSGRSAMGSDSIAAAIRSASADPAVRAIVLRVNSPGGSYVASDSIWREVVRVRAAGKPVVVSMGDVAASGGYFISMAADAIIAQPGTVTGSIGVVVGKPVLGELLGKAGISTDSIVLGQHAAMFSTAHPFTEADWALVNSWLDHIYADFTGKVAAGRRLSAERVHDLARGRVWTGADALERGLVDELGGLETATAIARRRAGLPGTAPLVAYPRTSALDRLWPASNSEDRRAAGLAAGSGALGAARSGGVAAFAGALGADLLAESWGPAWRLALRCGLPQEGPLMLPGSWTFH